jgi:hypothetical protein
MVFGLRSVEEKFRALQIPQVHGTSIEHDGLGSIRYLSQVKSIANAQSYGFNEIEMEIVLVCEQH